MYVVMCGSTYTGIVLASANVSLKKAALTGLGSHWFTLRPDLCPPLLYISCFSRGLLFYPEDGDKEFLRNVNTCLPNYSASHPRRL
jgi:hypothetical protein